MHALMIEDVAKSFAGTEAVKGISFSVNDGELFAMLGPNGAGKTTTIRMVLDIFKPDRGRIAVLGGPMSDATKDRIGYLPEERGLYRNLKVMDCLVFLAGLKGLSAAEARRRAGGWLERFDLAAHTGKKISDLSRGMQQKAQFITALIHEPDLIIVDEPFAALDPVNTRLIKDVLREQIGRGKTVIMSTHQMHLVEQLAERMAMINRGELVLYGKVDEVRRQFASNAVVVEGHGRLERLPGVAAIERQNGDGSMMLRLADGATPQSILRALADQQDYTVERFEIALPSLDDIFVRVAGGERVRS